MECIVQLDKTKDLDRCKEIIREMVDEEMSDELLTIVTNEIMDTCMFIGGDFLEDTVRDITRQYIQMGGIRRVKLAHGGIR